MKTLKKNHLAFETSPYLQQHVFNPVDWYPWGQTAIEKARHENKPILLSIGYTACHWCHVMAHESFEDSETAELMNRLFINIKVDREERPDLDKIYQTSHFLLNQRAGGWPLTIFLTPEDLAPFFSGTYFPLHARHQLPAFKDILKAVSSLYQNRLPDIQKQNIDLIKILQHTSTINPGTQLTDEPIHLALSFLQQRFDPIYGGFTGAPKFPHSSILEFLTKYHSPLAKESLHHMALGGINDQLGGGFFRYSVDIKWEIPHFEKMLYDNAQLLWVYTLATIEFSEPFFAETAKSIADWTINHMQNSAGGYFSSLDADSEGQEGKYYVWDKQEIKNLLTTEEFNLIEPYFGLNFPANFENKWHLYVAKPQSDDEINTLLSVKQKLLTAREKRIPPYRDEKILTAWNALMIKGMLKAGDFLNEKSFLDSAQVALTFIKNHCWHDKRLSASYKDNEAQIAGYLDDYAFLLDAVVTSLEIHWRSEDLLFAIDLADQLLALFADEIHGGFFFTANDHEKLLYRPKTMMDEAIPSGNSVAVQTLLTLGHLLGEERYLVAAEKTLYAAWTSLMSFPSEHCSLLLGLMNELKPPTIVVLRGKDQDMEKWRKECNLLKQHVFAIPATEKLPSSLALREPHVLTCAYICKGSQCSPVIENFEVFKKEIRSEKG